jgi:serine/threonine protein phosphatase PrpC
MPLTIDACVAQHIGDRKEQQDRAGLYQHPRQKKLVLAVVADGMGGHTGGTLAAEQVVLSAKNSLEQFSPQEESAAAMLTAALRESHMMIRTGRFLNEQDPHSTGVAMLLQGQGETMAASWAHCGDSRLYHFRGDQMMFHTADHSYVVQMVKKGYMTPEQGAVHPNKNVLVTSLGGDQEPMIDTGGTEGLAAGDSFLLCSDGLWGLCSDAEMGGLIAAYPAREAAGKLIECARARGNGHGDNCTLAIIKLVEPPASQTPPPAPFKPVVK